MKRISLRMRLRIIRFRYWIIEKLGGYTEQYTEIYQIDNRKIEIDPAIIRVETRMSFHQIYRDSEGEKKAYEYVMSKLCYDIARKLMENHLLTLDCKDDPPRYERVYSGMVMAIKPRDAALIAERKENERACY